MIVLSRVFKSSRLTIIYLFFAFCITVLLYICFCGYCCWRCCCRCLLLCCRTYKIRRVAARRESRYSGRRPDLRTDWQTVQGLNKANKSTREMGSNAMGWDGGYMVWYGGHGMETCIFEDHKTTPAAERDGLPVVSLRRRV